MEGAPGAAELLLDESAQPPEAPATPRSELLERVARGGFPEAVERVRDRRDEWLAAYLRAIVQRDLRDLANIERLSEVPAVLASLASRVRAPLNKTEVSSSVGIPRTSLDRYLTLLEHVFLVRRLPAWHTNRIKQISASRTRASLLHMRTAKGAEVDFVIEGPDGRIAGIEVKSSATVRGDDFRHLATLRDRLGDERFVRGVVLYDGSERLPFGERLEAWPLATLWTDNGDELTGR